MPIKTKSAGTSRRSRTTASVCWSAATGRALPKSKETWDLWWSQLGPSKELHAAIYGKNGPPMPWDEFRCRYLKR